MATGAPNPAAPSRKAPNEKAISSACKRWSGVTEAIESRMISNWPVLTVSLKRKTAATTIQAIGHKPKAKPLASAAIACGAGIP